MCNMEIISQSRRMNFLSWSLCLLPIMNLLCVFRLPLSFTWALGLSADPSHRVRIKRVWPRVMTSPAGNWGMFSHFLVRRVSSSVNDPTLIGLSPPDLWRVHRRGQVRFVTLITEIITPAHELLLNSLSGAVEILCDSNTTDVCETNCKNPMSSSFNGEKKETRFSQFHCQRRGCTSS